MVSSTMSPVPCVLEGGEVRGGLQVDCHYSEHLCSPQPSQPGQHKWVNEAAHYAYVITPTAPTLPNTSTLSNNAIPNMQTGVSTLFLRGQSDAD